MTGSRNPHLYEMQAMRQADFPEGRIAFMTKSKDEDCADLKRYVEGEISFRTLRKKIAVNNYLEKYYSDGMIPAKMLKDFIESSGWKRPHGDAEMEIIDG